LNPCGITLLQFKEKESAEKAYTQVKGQIFPKETGRPLEPHFITPEAAASSIEAAELAQKSGKKPVVYTGVGAVAAAVATTAAPKLAAPIAIRKDDVEGKPAFSRLGDLT